METNEFVEEIREDIRREDLMKFWATYGNYILGAIAALVLTTAGVLYWTHHQEQKKIEHASLYEKALEPLKSGDTEKTISLLTDLEKKAGDGYYSLIALKKASLEKDKGFAFRQVAQDQKVEKSFRDLALIMASLHDLDGKPSPSLTKELDSLKTSSSPFRPLAMEELALSLVKTGSGKEALDLLQNLTVDQVATPSLRARATALIEAIKGFRP